MAIMSDWNSWQFWLDTLAFSLSKSNRDFASAIAEGADRQECFVRCLKVFFSNSALGESAVVDHVHLVSFTHTLLRDEAASSFTFNLQKRPNCHPKQRDTASSRVNNCVFYIFKIRSVLSVVLYRG